MFGVELYKEKWNELLDYVKVLEQGNKVEKKIEKEVELISYWNKEVEEKIETKIVHYGWFDRQLYSVAQMA